MNTHKPTICCYPLVVCYNTVLTSGSGSCTLVMKRSLGAVALDHELRVWVLNALGHLLEALFKHKSVSQLALELD